MERKVFIKPNTSQAHWLVALANTQPKPAKELASPTRREFVIKHESLTKYIKHWATSGYNEVQNSK